MKRFVLSCLAALTALGVFESTSSAWVPAGIGCRNKRVGRIEGYWMQPTRGPLYDYSSYFATMYPWLPGAQEYRWQPPAPGMGYGTATAVLPYTPPPPPPKDPAAKPRKVELQPLPPK
jgi:hypothetical protein